MNNWQPIETAPKDGTEILVTDGSSMMICMYVEMGPSVKWLEAYSRDWIGHAEISHWMPLPEPPNE